MKYKIYALFSERAPPPGAYNPKFETDLSNSAKKGTTFYKSGRFPPIKFNEEGFAVPEPVAPISSCSRLINRLERSYSTASLNSTLRGRTKKQHEPQSEVLCKYNLSNTYLF